MPNHHSPLRYPGGKASIFNLLSRILELNNLERGHYLEPYAGGCGLALALLLEGKARHIHINDIDRSIWAFWDGILNHTEDFIEITETTPITIEEWHRQRKLFREPEEISDLELGFSAFFLNRTNRSGIIKSAGAIGGLEQTGKYLIDCRFNKEGLIRRIRRIAKYRSQIHLSQLDALDFMTEKSGNVGSKGLFCIDPPYFSKGSKLYKNHYKPSDHISVGEAVYELSNHWVVTYDNTPEIRKIYSSSRQYSLEILYSLQTKRTGSEILISSDKLNIPRDLSPLSEQAA